MVTVSKFYNSISATQIEHYEDIYKALIELADTYVSFLSKFRSMLVIDELYVIEHFQKCILEKFNLDNLFFAIKYIISHERKADLIDLIFSAISETEQEIYVWSRLKFTAATKVFIPLPFRYLTKNRHSLILNTLPEDILYILDGNETLDSAWLVQFGLLIRFRLISKSSALNIAAKLSELIGTFIEENHNIVYFMRLVFFDDLIGPGKTNETLNYLNSESFTKELGFDFDLKEFYIKLWQLIVSKVLISNHESKFIKFVYDLQSNLEIKFPGISYSLENLFLNSEDSLKCLNFDTLLSDFQVDSSEFESEIAKNSDFTFGSTIVCLSNRLQKIITMIHAVNRIQIEVIESESSNILINEISSLIINMEEHIKILPKITDFTELVEFVNFAFKLKSISVAKKVINFICMRIIPNSQLFSNFLEIFAENLIKYPNFFCLTPYSELFKNINLNDILIFIEKIKHVPITDDMLYFIAFSYMNYFNFFDQDLLCHFFENLNAFIKPGFTGGDGFKTFVSSVTDVSNLYFSEDTDFQKAFDQTQKNTLKLFQVLVNINPEFSCELCEVYIPLVISRLILNKDIIPVLVLSNQLEKFDINVNSLDIKAASILCTKIILSILNYGVSLHDLEKIFIFVS